VDPDLSVIICSLLRLGLLGMLTQLLTSLWRTRSHLISWQGQIYVGGGQIYTLGKVTCNFMVRSYLCRGKVKCTLWARSHLISWQGQIYVRGRSNLHLGQGQIYAKSKGKFTSWARSDLHLGQSQIYTLGKGQIYTLGKVNCITDKLRAKCRTVLNLCKRRTVSYLVQFGNKPSICLPVLVSFPNQHFCKKRN